LVFFLIEKIEIKIRLFKHHHHSIPSMGHSKSKMQGLVLPCQSGKTGRAINIIRERYQIVSKLHECESDVNIWISANNKLLVKQTESRMISELCEQEEEPEYDEKSDEDSDGEADAVIKGDVFSWMAGSKKNNISVAELALEIITDTVEMIVMCSNGIRVRYLNQLLERLHIMYLRGKFQKKINIWIDEADKSVTTWSKYPHVLEMGMINQVILVTATIESVIKKYHSIRVMQYATTYPACYRRMKDMECVEVDYASSDAVGYVRHILDMRHETLVQPGIRAFIPGKADRQSHEDISTYLLSIGFVVIILNGTHKEMRLPEGDVIDLRSYLTVSESSNPDEFNLVLSRMYVENRLDRYPLAITGFICVERGITFQCPPAEDHNGFLFDYGIIPPIPNKADAYQAMARLFGNIGHFPNYKPCQIYTTSATFKKVQNQEEIAVNLARLMYESDQDEATIATLKDASSFEKEKHLKLITKEFMSLDAANAHLKIHGFNQSKMESFERDPVDERFILSSLTQKKERLSYDEVKRIQLGWTKTSAFDGSQIKACRGRRMFICYKNMDDPTSTVFLIRILGKSE